MIQGATINGVQAHAIEDRVRWYHDRGGVVWHYRLRRPLSCLEEVDLNHFCRRMIGRRYDWTGAIGSRNTLGAFVRRRIFTAEDLAALFCSEFCAAALVKGHPVGVRKRVGTEPERLLPLGVRPGRTLLPRVASYTAGYTGEGRMIRRDLFLVGRQDMRAQPCSARRPHGQS
jgi:hypothetical protein